MSRLEGGRWSSPQTLPFSGTYNDREPKLTPDGPRLYFSSNRPVYFISTRPGGVPGPTPRQLNNVWRAAPLDDSGLRFGAPQNLGAAINKGFETNVYVSPDERTMLVSRDGAPDGLGGDDLYVSKFVNGAWQVMRHLPAPINSKEYEYGPHISPDGQWLFFTSIRAGAADIYRVPIAAIDRP